MIKPNNKIQTVSDARRHAESFVKQGVALLAYALNATDDVRMTYRYGDLEQERLNNLVIELIDIVERGKVELLAGSRANKDIKFQKFLMEVTKL